MQYFTPADQQSLPVYTQADIERELQAQENARRAAYEKQYPNPEHNTPSVAEFMLATGADLEQAKAALSAPPGTPMNWRSYMPDWKYDPLGMQAAATRLATGLNIPFLYGQEANPLVQDALKYSTDPAKTAQMWLDLAADPNYDGGQSVLGGILRTIRANMAAGGQLASQPQVASGAFTPHTAAPVAGTKIVPMFTADDMAPGAMNQFMVVGPNGQLLNNLNIAGGYPGYNNVPTKAQLEQQALQAGAGPEAFDALAKQFGFADWKSISDIDLMRIGQGMGIQQPLDMISNHIPITVQNNPTQSQWEAQFGKGNSGNALMDAWNKAHPAPPAYAVPDIAGKAAEIQKQIADSSKIANDAYHNIQLGGGYGGGVIGPNQPSYASAHPAIPQLNQNGTWQTPAPIAGFSDIGQWGVPQSSSYGMPQQQGFGGQFGQSGGDTNTGIMSGQPVYGANNWGSFGSPSSGGLGGLGGQQQGSSWGGPWGAKNPWSPS